jgi:nucleotide-binding universal stress UspA family protein
MFKKILVPVDGSPLSLQAANAAVTLARDVGAEIVGFIATPIYKTHVIEDAAFAPGTLSESDFTHAVTQSINKHLGEIEQMAVALTVPFSRVSVTSENPAQAIVDVAAQYGCDLICMGSHGRSAIAQLFLGGVTTKVLSVSAVPVLVFRAAKRVQDTAVP